MLAVYLILGVGTAGAIFGWQSVKDKIGMLWAIILMIFCGVLTIAAILGLFEITPSNAITTVERFVQRQIEPSLTPQEALSQINVAQDRGMYAARGGKCHDASVYADKVADLANRGRLDISMQAQSRIEVAVRLKLMDLLDNIIRCNAAKRPGFND